jgi:phosphoglucosamine mutase
MTVRTATDLGQALAWRLRDQGKRGRIVVGKDTRTSGYLFENALSAGILSMGGRVLECGPVPTPAVAHLIISLRADAGLVISASHNPFEDNGIKVFGADGFKLPDSVEAELEELMGRVDQLQGPIGTGVGTARHVDDARGRYIANIKHSFPNDLRLDGLKIAVDCAHGAAYKVAPSILWELGAETVPIGVDPDGININDGCGALYPENVAAAVIEHGCDLGIALDGDADRLILVDERGDIVDGDQIMAICATQLMKKGRLAGNTLVATVMSNLGLEVAMKNQGIELLRTQVGDRYVVEAMRSGGFNLGGEQSGHLIFMDHSTTGDGLLAALQVLAVLLRDACKLSELAAVMTRYPQSLVNVMVTEKTPVDELEGVSRSMAAAQEALGDDGRILVRYSGTENKARVMVEGPDQDTVDYWALAVAGEFRAAIGAEEAT